LQEFPKTDCPALFDVLPDSSRRYWVSNCVFRQGVLCRFFWMHVTKLMVNARPALPTSTRQAVRAAVHQLEQRFAQSTDSGITAELKSELNRAAGRVVRLAQFRPAEGRALKVRIGKLRQFTKIN